MRQKQRRRRARRVPVLVLACVLVPVAGLLFSVRGAAAAAPMADAAPIGATPFPQYAYNWRNPRPSDLKPEPNKRQKPYRPLRETPGTLPARHHRRGTLVFSSDLVVGLAALPLLAVAALWLARSLQLPPVPLLLLFGLVSGPLTGWLDPDVVFGNLSLPVVALAMAVLLFDMGVHLPAAALREIGRPLGWIVAADLVMTMIIGAALGYFVLGLDGPLAAMFGVLVALALPTLLAPLLRGLRPHSDMTRLRGIEGRVLNLAGVALLVPLFQAAFFAPRGAVIVSIVGGTLAVGAIVGVAGASLIVALQTRDAIPEGVRTAVNLMLVIGTFVIAEWVQTDAGLLAVIVLAVVLSNQRIARPAGVRGLSDEVRSCLEGVLLVWFAARLRVSDLALVGAGGFACLGFVALIARTAALLVATAGSEAGRQERLVVFWQAPRALIPAAAAVFFGVRLVDGGHNGAEHLVPLVLLAVSTAAVCALLAPVIAPLVPERRRQPEAAVTSTARPAS